MSIFDDIKTGLNQAIDFEKGKGKGTGNRDDHSSGRSVFTGRNQANPYRYRDDAGAVCAVYGRFRKNRGGMGSRQKSSGRSRLPPSCHDKKRS